MCLGLNLPEEVVMDLYLPKESDMDLNLSEKCVMDLYLPECVWV